MYPFHSFLISKLHTQNLTPSAMLSVPPQLLWVLEVASAPACANRTSSTRIAAFGMSATNAHLHAPLGKSLGFSWCIGIRVGNRSGNSRRLTDRRTEILLPGSDQVEIGPAPAGNRYLNRSDLRALKS